MRFPPGGFCFFAAAPKRYARRRLKPTPPGASTHRCNPANRSLTLSAVGSFHTVGPVAGGEMALANKKSFLPAAEERRRFQRVRVHLLGRYMLPDRREFPCQIINMSPGGLALLAPGIGNVGDRVIAYLDHIGRVEGKITRIIDNGFAMTVGATARKRDKLAAQLTWLANRDILNLPEDRRHDRIVPRNPIALLTLEDGTKMTCRVIDMSASGAAIAAENRPPLKSLVMLGKVQSRVGRNLEEGFALEFVHQQNSDTLEDSVTAWLTRAPYISRFLRPEGGVRVARCHASALRHAPSLQLTRPNFAAATAGLTVGGTL